MSETTLIRNATVVNFDSIAKNQSILVENGVITFVGDEKSLKTTPAKVKVIDAKEKYVIPGGIDPHTHLEEHLDFDGKELVTADDFYHGTRAAVCINKIYSKLFTCLKKLNN